MLRLPSWPRHALDYDEGYGLRPGLPKLAADAAFIVVVVLSYLPVHDRRGLDGGGAIRKWLRSSASRLRAWLAGRRSVDAEAVVTDTLERWRDVYRQMTLVERWREGKVPLVGGIRLLREQGSANEGTAPGGAVG